MGFLVSGRVHLLLAAFSFVTPWARATPVLTDFNLVVGGNLTSNSEVEGRTLIGGVLSGSASNYGVALTPSSAFSDTDTLVVGGSITAGNINVSAGDVRVGGSAAGTVNLNGVGSDLVQNDAAAAGLVSSVLSQLHTFSAYVAGLVGTSTVSNPAGPSAVTFNATNGLNNTAVFNVDGAVFNDPHSQQYDLNIEPDVDFIFLNVSGKSIDFNQGNFTGSFADPNIGPYLLWNFVDAETINLERGWYGSIMAPYASLTNSAAIDGSVFIGGDFNQRGEMHLPLLLLTSGGESPVPEPGTIALVVSSLGALGLSKRRRSAS